LWGMGTNADGELGIDELQSLTPVALATDVIRVSAGARHSLFVKRDRTAWAMGFNQYGQIGDGSRVNATHPVQILTDVTDVAAGWCHSLFRKMLPPAITAQPQGATVLTGRTATITVGAGGGSLRYQWYAGPSGDTDHPIGGATEATL